MFLTTVSTRASLLPRVPYLLRRNYAGRDPCSIRVVTDIDDTVKSSGGVRLFGIALGGIDVSLLISSFLE